MILAGKNGLKIGQWNVNHLTDIELEEIKLLTSMNYEICILFIIETFVKPSKPDSMLELPGYMLHRYIGEVILDERNVMELLRMSVITLKGVHVSGLDDDEVESLWLNINHLDVNSLFSLEQFIALLIPQRILMLK